MENNIDLLGRVVCPKCGSVEVQCFAGMFVDRYVCKKCGNEFRL